jgi:hypothetical protein
MTGGHPRCRLDFDGCLVPTVTEDRQETTIVPGADQVRRGGGKLSCDLRCGDHLGGGPVLRGLGLRFDAVNRNLKCASISTDDSRKISADHYIDDKAMKIEWNGTNHFIG